MAIKSFKILNMVRNIFSYWLLLTVNELIIELGDLLNQEILAQINLLFFNIEVDGGALIHTHHVNH